MVAADRHLDHHRHDPCRHPGEGKPIGRKGFMRYYDKREPESSLLSFQSPSGPCRPGSVSARLLSWKVRAVLCAFIDHVRRSVGEAFVELHYPLAHHGRGVIL